MTQNEPFLSYMTFVKVFYPMSGKETRTVLRLYVILERSELAARVCLHSFDTNLPRVQAFD